MATLQKDLDDHVRDVTRLNNLAVELPRLSPAYQKLVAEITVLRLHYILQNTIISIMSKLVCKTNYLDGTTPIVYSPQNNKTQAINAMQTYSRANPIRLHWSKAGDIKRNVKYVLDTSEHAISVIDAHSDYLDEITRVRNRIAHNNRSARDRFQFVVQRYYGAARNGVTPGILLLTSRRSPNLLTQYITKSHILIKTIVKS